jgi:hypothetical protein
VAAHSIGDDAQASLFVEPEAILIGCSDRPLIGESECAK